MSQPPWYPGQPRGPSQAQWNTGQQTTGFGQWHQSGAAQPQPQSHAGFQPHLQYQVQQPYSGNQYGMGQLRQAHAGFHQQAPMQYQHQAQPGQVLPQFQNVQVPNQFQNFQVANQFQNIPVQNQFHNVPLQNTTPFPQGVPVPIPHIAPLPPPAGPAQPDLRVLAAEHERIAREEQRKREFEIQKRKLRGIDVSKPVSGLDDLLGQSLASGLTLTGAGTPPRQTVLPSSSPSPSASPRSASRRDSGASEAGLPSVSHLDSDVGETWSSAAETQSQQAPAREDPSGGTLASAGGAGEGEGEGEWGEFGGAAVDTREPVSSAGKEEQKEEENVPSKPTTADTFEKLMSASLSTLSDPAQAKKRRLQFASPVRDSSKPSSRPSTTPSIRARAWTSDGADFEGVFVQQPAEEERAADDFCEFQSSVIAPVGLAPPPTSHLGTGTAALAELGDFQLATSSPSPVLPVTEGAHQQAPPQVAVQWSGISGASRSGAFTTPTSAYTQPITVATLSTGGLPGVTEPTPPLEPESRGSAPGSSGASVSRGSDDRSAREISPSGGRSLDSALFPPIYSAVHERCAVPGQAHVSTKLLYPLLLSSGLPRDVLRDLWSTANREEPGRLTQSELFVLLGFIALAQSGCPAPSLKELKEASGPPIPRLTLPPLSQTAAATLQPLPSAKRKVEDDFGEFQAGSEVGGSEFGGQPESQVEDKYSAFHEIAPAAAVPRPPLVPGPDLTPAPPTSHPGREYGVFSKLHEESLAAGAGLTNPLPPEAGLPAVDSSIIITSSTSSALPTSSSSSSFISSSFSSVSFPVAVTAVRPSETNVSFGLLSPASSSEATSLTSTLLTTPTIPVGGTENTGRSEKPVDDDFGDFSSALPNTSSGDPPPSSLPPATSEFGAFAQFDSVASITASHAAPPIGLKPTPAEQVPSVQAAVAVEEDWADFTQSSEPPLHLKPSGGLSSTPPPQTNVSTEEAKGLGLEVATPSSAVAAQREAFKAEGRSFRSMDALEAELFNLQLGPVIGAGTTGNGRTEEEGKEGRAVDDDSFGEFAVYGGPSDGPLVPEPGRSEGPLLLRAPPKHTLRNASEVWRSCLNRCSELLSDSVHVFSEARKEEKILEEIVGSEEGRNKLKGVVGVYRLAKRLHCSLGSRGADAADERVARSIRQHWKALGELLPNDVMTQLYAETTPTLPEHDDMDVLSDTISKCSLCHIGKWVAIPAPLSLDGAQEEYGQGLLFHKGDSYHAPCANFWRHACLEDLPITFVT